MGFWKDRREIATQWQTDRRFVSTAKPAARNKLLAGWAQALARAGRWAGPE